MSFRVRLAGLCLLLGVLAAAFLLGLLLSPQRRERRETEQPLLPPHSLEEVAGLEVVRPGTSRVELARQADRWVVLAGGHTLPASAERVAALLRGLREARRGRVVSAGGSGQEDSEAGGAALEAQLGLSGEQARSLVLRRSGGRPDLELLVGKRGPGGQEDYVRLRGEPAVYLVRGSLGPTLEQDRTYWYDLHVLPDDVLGTTVARIRVSGGGGRSYTLVRSGGGQEGKWSIQGDERPVNRLAAGAMANSLALLQGVDFQLEPAQGSAPPAGERLAVQVTTLEGKSYSLEVLPAADPEKRLVSAGWSGRTYVVNAVALRRAALPLEALLGG